MFPGRAILDPYQWNMEHRELGWNQFTRTGKSSSQSLMKFHFFSLTCIQLHSLGTDTLPCHSSQIDFRKRKSMLKKNVQAVFPETLPIPSVKADDSGSQLLAK